MVPRRISHPIWKPLTNLIIVINDSNEWFNSIRQPRLPDGFYVNWVVLWGTKEWDYPQGIEDSLMRPKPSFISCSHFSSWHIILLSVYLTQLNVSFYQKRVVQCPNCDTYDYVFTVGQKLLNDIEKLDILVIAMSNGYWAEGASWPWPAIAELFRSKLNVGSRRPYWVTSGIQRLPRLIGDGRSKFLIDLNARA